MTSFLIEYANHTLGNLTKRTQLRFQTRLIKQELLTKIFPSTDNQTRILASTAGIAR